MLLQLEMLFLLQSAMLHPPLHPPLLLLLLHLLLLWAEA